MKIINIVFIMLSLLLMSKGVMAHQTELSSTLLVEQSKHQWVLQIRASINSFKYEIEYHYGLEAYSTPEEFQELVIAHLQKNISVHFNEANGVALQNASVNLGHETSVTFDVIGIPQTIHYLNIKNTSFGDIPRNKGAVMIHREGFSKNQFILNKDNSHAVSLKVDDSTFELVGPTQESQYNYFLIFASALITLLLYFSIRKRLAVKTNVRFSTK